MTEQPLFVHPRLEFKLQELLASALSFVNGLSKEDVLQCDNACLTEIIRQFAVAPPILRPDLVVVDDNIRESKNIFSDRSTGQTLHSFFIPVERNAEWLEDVGSQKTNIDSLPLAFLDRERAWIDIRLVVSPEDEEGALQRELDHRKIRIKQYVDSVADKLIEFNEDLARQMATELNTRKNSIATAERELESIGIPRVHNPAHAERAVQIERLMRNLGGYVENASSSNERISKQEIRSFIVHGHDSDSLLELKDYLQNTLGMSEPTVLRQTPGQGKTIIEKFEREAESTEVVFVLLTPDDKIINSTGSENISEKRRARQNVILELGFFLGKLGRESGRVLLLHKGPLEIPSDIAGVEYIDIANGVMSAGEDIRRELQALGVLG